MHIAERATLNAQEAARFIGISTRKLWELTNRGEIPHVRIGGRVLYLPKQLEDWLLSRSSDRRRGR